MLGWFKKNKHLPDHLFRGVLPLLSNNQLNSSNGLIIKQLTISQIVKFTYFRVRLNKK